MASHILVFFVYLLLHFVCDAIAGEYHQVTIADTFQYQVLKEIEDLTQFQCLHRCNITPLCKDVAIGVEGVCLLLKEAGGGGKKIEARRISNMKLPPKKVPPPGT